jgi:general secretion pathway protein C
MNAASSWLDTIAVREKWHGALKSRGPRIAVWVLAIALGAEAANVVTRLAGSGSSPTAAQVTAAAPQPTHIDVAAIAAGHLFGAAPVAAPTATNAPQTTMALVLTGTIAANHPEDGLAILGPSVTQVRVYGVGDNVPGGARLHAVYDDRVLLDRAGRLETLTLPRKFGTSATGTQPPIGDSPQNSFERVRRVISQDPGIIADVMRPQPVFADGKQRGYRVYPGRNSQAFLSLGLRPGDLVIAINNTPLDDPARGDEIFRTLGSSSEARVTVMRNGRQQDLTLNMSQIASEADQLSAEPGAGGAVPPAFPGGTGPQGPE